MELKIITVKESEDSWFAYFEDDKTVSGSGADMLDAVESLFHLYTQIIGPVDVKIQTV